MIDSPEILRLIETASLFRGIPHTVLDPLINRAELVTLKPGDKLLSPEIINEHVYIIISGRLSVQITPSNLDDSIAMLTPGECVGEMSVLVDSLVSAYVIATTDCQLLSLDYNTFWSLIEGSNEAARNMLNILVHRIRLGNEIMADSLLHHDNFPDSEIIDKLTGLFNFHGMHHKFDRLLHRCAVDKKPLCIILLEINDPEKDTDSARGLRDDQSLRTIAQTMLSFLRPDDHAARLIGNKFAVLLVNSSLTDANATAERLRTAISKTSIIMPDGSVLPPFGISIAVNEALPNDNWNTLLGRTDITLEQSTTSNLI